MDCLGKIIHRDSPTFAALASLRLRSGHALREIFRVSVCRARTFALVIHRIKYQQRKT
jgi:hypothetical protein